jgi:hypothetical protein
MQFQKGVLFRTALGSLLVSAASASYAQSAVPSDSEDSGIENSHASSDIVVTARKREESAQDVPLALDVAGGEELAARSVRDLSDIMRLAPAIRFTPGSINPTGVWLAARGLHVQDTRLTTDPAIGLYIDGVYIPRLLGITASELIDVQRVEELLTVALEHLGAFRQAGVPRRAAGQRVAEHRAGQRYADVEDDGEEHEAEEKPAKKTRKKKAETAKECVLPASVHESS